MIQFDKWRMLAYELDAVLIDTERRPFDQVCRNTITRVRDVLLNSTKCDPTSATPDRAYFAPCKECGAEYGKDHKSECSLLPWYERSPSSSELEQEVITLREFGNAAVRRNERLEAENAELIARVSRVERELTFVMAERDMASATAFSTGPDVRIPNRYPMPWNDPIRLLERVQRQMMNHPLNGRQAILGDGLCEDIENALRRSTRS